MKSDPKNADASTRPNVDLLRGVRILSFTHYLQGPSGVQILADLGADVINVEPPQGNFERHWAGANARRNGESVFFLCANRNKRSLSVNLKDPDGVQVIRDLIPKVDVLVENFRPGVMDKLGFGYDAVKKLNPGVIYVECSGYGSDGPYRDRPGQDMIIQSLSGLAAVTGNGHGPPTPVGAAIVDQHGAVLLAMGTLAALFRRSASGAGCRVEVNLLNAALDLQIEALTYFLNGAPMQPRSTASISSWHSPAPYGVYATADGYIGVSLNPVGRMAAALECPELEALSGSDPYEERDAISNLIQGAMRKRPTKHWLAVFEQHALWYAPVSEYADLLNDPQIAHNNMFVDAEDANGRPIRLVAHPVRYDGQAPSVRRPPPRLGQHSAEILENLGYSGEKIRRLFEQGSVKLDPTGDR